MIRLIPVFIVCFGMYSFALQGKQASPHYRVKVAANEGQGSSALALAEDLKHEVENHEIELRMFEERLNTQETIIDTLRQQFLDANLANQKTLKGNAISLEKQVSSLDSSCKGMAKDLVEVQSHANEQVKLFNQYKQRITAIEKQMQQMQEALQAILNALQIDAAPSPEPTHFYKVKPGDSLAKIAHQHSTSIKKIKELNGLENDRIFVGQKLKLR